MYAKLALLHNTRKHAPVLSARGKSANESVQIQPFRAKSYSSSYGGLFWTWRGGGVVYLSRVKSGKTPRKITNNKKDDTSVILCAFSLSFGVSLWPASGGIFMYVYIYTKRGVVWWRAGWQ